MELHTGNFQHTVILSKVCHNGNWSNNSMANHVQIAELSGSDKTLHGHW